jgi:hypothetical protein
MEKYTEITVPVVTTKPVVESSVEEHVEVDLDSKKKTKVYVPSERTEKTMPEEVVIEQEVVDEVKPVIERQNVKRQSRAQKRIRELNSRANDLEAQLEKERKEKYELMKKVNGSVKSSLEDNKNSIQALINSNINQMRVAMQEGNSDLVVSLQAKNEELRDQLIDIKMNLKVNELEEVEDYKPKPKQYRPSEYAVAWMEDYGKHLRSDPYFENAAFTINESLVREGYDHESEEFYEELSFRLKRRFPDYFVGSKQKFGVEDEDVLEYSQEPRKTSSNRQAPSISQEDFDEGDIEDVKKAVRPQAPRQTVSGASRTTSAVPNRRPIANKVTLSPKDLEHIDAWNMSMERMARRKIHMANNTRDDGYVPIIIPSETSR